MAVYETPIGRLAFPGGFGDDGCANYWKALSAGLVADIARATVRAGTACRAPTVYIHLFGADWWNIASAATRADYSACEVAEVTRIL
jgi:hypothetical protein